MLFSFIPSRVLGDQGHCGQAGLAGRDSKKILGFLATAVQNVLRKKTAVTQLFWGEGMKEGGGGASLPSERL